mgnify:CR=1 FL=1
MEATGDGDTHIMLGDIQAIGDQAGAIQDIGEVATTATTTIAILTEEEVLQVITETATMLTTEITLLAEAMRPTEIIQPIETTLPIEEITPQTEEAIQLIEIIPQIDHLTVIQTLEEALT